MPGWKVLRTPHNEYLMILVEFGVVGLISILLFFYCQFRQSFRLGELSFFAQGLILAFMISSFYNAFLYSAVTGHFYVFFIALFFGSVIPFMAFTVGFLALDDIHHLHHIIPVAVALSCEPQYRCTHPLRPTVL